MKVFPESPEVYYSPEVSLEDALNLGVHQLQDGRVKTYYPGSKILARVAITELQIKKRLKCWSSDEVRTFSYN